MTILHHQQMQPHHRSNQSRAHHVIKAATAATMGGSLLILSCLALLGTVITLALATPLLVLFSPVLIPAVIAFALLAIGFLSSGGFGVAAAMVFAWMHRFVTGEGPTGDASSSDQVRHEKVGWKGGRGHHATGGVRLTTGARTGLYKS
ncbi:hypothetical protein QVD17_35752 [Tagetes erecta]|uniref:Oleosin n=1 Tax=Tagetes erecta TaxID=13708 RepID=A0AAD8JV01_TARER|nr:hypothetical protein QVD17_35752 [Tagetes erecta]